jgi:hypothetical protein
MLGIAEWGPVGKPQVCVSYTDFEKKFGSFIANYYLAKCADAFFREGGSQLYVVRTAHYTAGVLDAVKSSYTGQGCNAGAENRARVDSLKIEAYGEGSRGDKVIINTQKASAVASGAIAATSIAVDDASGFEVGDIIDIIDPGGDYVRVIITAISSNTIYFKSVTVAGTIGSGAAVTTLSKHSVQTTAEEGIASNATQLLLTNAAGIAVGKILSIIDTRSAAPNVVNVKVTSISGNTISFADVGTITTIAQGDILVVSQEFNLEIYFDTTDNQVEKYEYLTLESEDEENYIEEKISTNYYVEVDELGSTEDIIGKFPVAESNTFLTGGDDGLTGLSDQDFIGSVTVKNGLYAFDTVPNMFAQIGCPDMRSAAFQRALDTYAGNRGLWVEHDFDFDLTYDETVDHLLNTAMLNTNYGEANWPNVLWKNPLTGAIQAIPQCGATMGLNARVWSAVQSGPWIAAAGVEDGVYNTVVGFENDETDDLDVRDYLYDNKINSLYSYPGYGPVKYGIRTLESNGQFPQVPERVVFLYCRHSVINGTPWVVFKNIDTSNLARLKKTVEKFLRGVWLQGGLKGATEEDAFTVDVSEESVNTVDRQEKGEMWCKIGLATKKAGEFVYFEFNKKVG